MSADDFTNARPRGEDERAAPRISPVTHATLRRAILTVYGLAVMALMVAPVRTPRFAAGVPQADKIVHAALFGVMTGAVWWNLAALRRGRVFWAVVLATLFAVLVEVVQHFVPYRSADPLDAAAGLGGALVCAFVLVRVVARREPGTGKRETGAP
jgi:VanZ family protein